MLGLSSDINGWFKFICSEAESQKGPLPQMGNSCTRAAVSRDVSDFVVDWTKAGNNHHLGLSIGHNNGVIEKLCKVLPYVKHIFIPA